MRSSRRFATGWQEEGIDFNAAASQIPREVIFTTHTPVPAGHDRFNSDLIEEHLGPLREQLGISHENLMGFGREYPTDHGEQFCMTVLGLKLSRRANAVSSLHGEVSRAMWKCLYPGKPEDAVPIGHITNGVHVPSWLAPQMCRLYDRHLGVGWQRDSGSAQTWEEIENVDDGELWETHLSLKAQLLDFVRRRAREQAERRDEPQETLGKLGKVLSPDALTIGFARRFATYKRANLLLADMQAAGRDGQRSQAAGAIRLCGQGASARRAGQEGAAADCRDDARLGVRQQVRLHRGLRHQRGPLPGAGRGCVAEQSAAAAGGLGHQRAEGGAQRRAESFRAGRLVGRGLRRAERLRHRHRQNALEHGCARQPRRRRPLPRAAATS